MSYMKFISNFDIIHGYLESKKELVVVISTGEFHNGNYSTEKMTFDKWYNTFCPLPIIRKPDWESCVIDMNSVSYPSNVTVDFITFKLNPVVYVDEKLGVPHLYYGYDKVDEYMEGVISE